MNKEEIFSIWSPENSLWSPWVKPVLFSYMDSVPATIPISEPLPDTNWLLAGGEKVVLVLDLPGAKGVLAGLALAELGCRPVPLYNAVPLPTNVSVLEPLSRRPVAAVDILAVVQALRTGANRLRSLRISADASPVFLLDANRHGEGRKMLAGEFDNRSICFTTDFPSANFLTTHGFQRVLLVQNSNAAPQRDLAHVLRRWQDGGLLLERVGLSVPEKPERFEVARPAWYHAMFQRALAALGLRHAKAGGFGAWVPDAAAGG